MLSQCSLVEREGRSELGFRLSGVGRVGMREAETETSH